MCFYSVANITVLFTHIGIFTHLKLCLADAIHNFKWVKMIRFDKKLTIDFTFHLIQKLVFNVLIKNEYNIGTLQFGSQSELQHNNDC